jgi:SAM-dependent methyltransferase
MPSAGIDASSRMAARLRAKPGGSDLHVTVADLVDLADIDIGDGGFDLVYVVASTLYCLTSQGEQARCLANAARRLRPDGRLVVEAFVPDVARFDRGQRVDARHIDTGQVRLDVARHDPVTQTVVSQQSVFEAGGVRLYPTYVAAEFGAMRPGVTRVCYVGLDSVFRAGCHIMGRPVSDEGHSYHFVAVV